MKKSKILVLTMLTATTLSNVLPQTIAFGAEKMQPPSTFAVEEEQHTARYVILDNVNLNAQISNSGASYNLYVSGSTDIIEISGWVTLYKKGSSGEYSEVSSEYINEATYDLDLHGSLPTDGPGTYRLEVDGTAYTSNDSEDFFKSIIKSY